MIDGHTITLVMPARNEGACIPALLANIPEEFDEVIVVSNRSTDDTVDKVLEAAIEDEHRTGRRRIKAMIDDTTKGGIGYGAAIRSGIAVARGDYIVTADCDGTYPFADAVTGPTFVRDMISDDLQFISCSRYPDPEIPAFLRLGVNVLTHEMRLLFGMPITDALTGMMIARKDFLESLHLSEIDWNLCPEMKLAAWLATDPGKWQERRIKQHIRSGGTTKQHHIKTGISHLLYIATYKVRHHER